MWASSQWCGHAISFFDWLFILFCWCAQLKHKEIFMELGNRIEEHTLRKVLTSFQEMCDIYEQNNIFNLGTINHQCRQNTDGRYVMSQRNNFCLFTRYQQNMRHEAHWKSIFLSKYSHASNYAPQMFVAMLYTCSWIYRLDGPCRNRFAYVLFCATRLISTTQD